MQAMASVWCVTRMFGLQHLCGSAMSATMGRIKAVVSFAEIRECQTLTTAKSAQSRKKM